MKDIVSKTTVSNRKEPLLRRKARGSYEPPMLTDRAPRPRHTDRRTLLRDEGARIFAERGYHGASMQEIADAIGFTKASIYYYYKGKEELLFDILTFADEEVTALFAAEAQVGNDPLLHVGRLVAIHVTWYLQHPNIAKVAFRDWTALTEPMLTAQTDRRREHSHVLRNAIERCRTEGLIAGDAKVGLITNFINGAVAASNVWFKPTGPETPETVGKAFGDMAVAVLLGKSPV